MNAGASLSAVPSPIEGSGTAWVLLGSWALSPARPTPIPPRHECRGFSALLVSWNRAAILSSGWATTKPNWHVKPAIEKSCINICASYASKPALVPCISPQNPLPLEQPSGSARFPDIRGIDLLAPGAVSKHPACHAGAGDYL